MGNRRLWCISPIRAAKNTKIIKLFDSDGCERRLQELHITANEIMKRYPQNIVAQADSFFIGEKIPVLSADDKLVAGKTYFLLPEKMKGIVLSASWLASLAGKAKASTVSPVGIRISSDIFEAEKREDGTSHLRVLPEFIQKLLEVSRSLEEASGSSQEVSRNSQEASRSSQSSAQDDDCCSGLCNSPELQKDYEQLVGGRAQAWRPRLETIVEEHRRHGLFRHTRKN